jgi:hypothetical protein
MQPVSMTSPGAPHYQQRADTRSYPSLHSRAVCQSARSYPSPRDVTNCKRFLSFSSSVSLEVPERAATTTQDPTRDHTPVSATYRQSPQHIQTISATHTDHLRNIPTVSATYRPSPQHTDRLRNIPTVSASTEHAHHAASAQQSSHRRWRREPSPLDRRHRELRALAPTRYSIIMRYHYSIIMHLQYCNEWAPALVQRSPLVAPTRYSIIMRIITVSLRTYSTLTSGRQPLSHSLLLWRPLVTASSCTIITVSLCTYSTLTSGRQPLSHGLLLWRPFVTASSCVGPGSWRYSITVTEIVGPGSWRAQRRPPASPSAGSAPVPARCNELHYHRAVMIL